MKYLKYFLAILAILECLAWDISLLICGLAYHPVSFWSIFVPLQYVIFWGFMTALATFNFVNEWRKLWPQIKGWFE